MGIKMKKDHYDYHTDYGGRIHPLYDGEALGGGLLALFGIALVIYRLDIVFAILRFIAAIVGMVLISNYCKKRVSQRTWIILNVTVVAATIIGGILALILIPPLL